MFKVKFFKLMLPIIVLMSFIIIAESKAQENKTLSVISVEELNTDKNSASKLFTLYQNENTHFANVSKIKFDLCLEANVVLNVIDKQGKIVENLIDGSMEPGQYSVFLKLPDGIIPGELSYAIEVNGMSDSKRILINK